MDSDRDDPQIRLLAILDRMTTRGGYPESQEEAMLLYAIKRGFVKVPAPFDSYYGGEASRLEKSIEGRPEEQKRRGYCTCL